MSNNKLGSKNRTSLIDEEKFNEAEEVGSNSVYHDAPGGITFLPLY